MAKMDNPTSQGTVVVARDPNTILLKLAKNFLNNHLILRIEEYAGECKFIIQK